MADCQPIEPFAFNGEVDCSRPRSGPPPTRGVGDNSTGKYRWQPAGEHSPALGQKRGVEIGKRYLTAEHIDQLRQVVNPRVPEELANLGGLPRPSRCGVPRVMRGGPESQPLKTATTAADALSPFQNRTRTLQLNC